MKKATVVFDPIAYLKMKFLILQSDTEIAWHGVVTKHNQDSGPEYFVRDILLYPQIVTGVTVENDDDEYLKWLMQLETEDANALRMQGHSHVLMSVSPSSTDIENQKKILQQTGQNGFYLFEITNKYGEYFWNIFDFDDESVYLTKDVDMCVEGEAFSFTAMLGEMETKMKKGATINESIEEF